MSEDRYSEALQDANIKPLGKIATDLELDLSTVVTPLEKTSKKPWLLATIVLFATVSCMITEGQLVSLGFALQYDDKTVTSENGTEVIIEGGDRFAAPHFYVLCRFTTRILAFPLMFLGTWLYSVLTCSKSFTAKGYYRHCLQITGTDKLTVVKFFKLFSLPAIFAVGQACDVVALTYIPPSIVSACYSSVVALSYILSIFFLTQTHLIVKSLFVVVSFSGVAMMAYETTTDPIQPNAFIGIAAVMAACVSLSLHQLTYTKSFPEGDPSQSAFTVTVMFTICAVLYLPVPLALKFQGLEIWHFADAPWGHIFGGVFAGLGFACLYAYGLSISSPFFMSLAELLNLVGHTVVDNFFRSIETGPLQTAGIVIIATSLIVLLVPDRVVTVDYLKARVMLCFGRSAVHTSVLSNEPAKVFFIQTVE